MKFSVSSQPAATPRLDGHLIHSFRKVYLRAVYGLCPEGILVTKADVPLTSKTHIIQKGSKHRAIENNYNKIWWLAMIT